ncbi:helix-turn-helix transcriptional regulator [Polaromonas sp. C04]|uniref:helix-turn-helix domain-containing protein n=1 Tax=Polaromonas sp. C04 TaxID=1945857 RepID=UPI0009851F82|nr:helix-turn-helix transcriptional regulator [Polaromonas sp. C04]OOG58059.1 hypothetical protein B0E49_04315 [Polaromonas sp. C04]
MHTISGSRNPDLRRKTSQLEFTPAQSRGSESKADRVERLYQAPGGPLMGWVFDEAQSRGHDVKEVAQALGVTYGYINQLRNGVRNTADISQDFAEACARYLGSIPTVVIKLLAGNIRLSDFLYRQETEEEAIDRSLRQMLEDPKMRAVLPAAADLASWTVEAKRAIVLMYAEVSCSDFFNTRELPNILFWLQRAAVAHDENEFAAMAGHRDTAANRD